MIASDREPVETTVAARQPLAAGAPVGLLIVIGLTFVSVVLAVSARILPEIALRVGAIAAGHGALLAVAIAWADDGRSRSGRRTAVAAAPAVLLAVAAACAALHPLGAVAYLVVPAYVGLLASHGRLRRLGLGLPVPRAALLLGAGTGAFLGAHVLLSATRTFGYHIRRDDLASLVPFVLYDAGANVLTAECFFRGALFGRLVRRWSFWPAAAVATLACLARYLVDPLVPKTTEIVVGAVLYLGIQSLANCWLLWWSGSLVPGLLGGLAFFVLYRALSAG